MLETVYKNAKTKMKYICLKHPNKIKERTWDVFKRCKYGCDECEGELISKRLTYSYEFVYHEFERRNYKLLDTHYINSCSSMSFICSQHPDDIQSITFTKMMQGAMCKKCAREATLKSTRYTKEFVFEEFKKKDLIVIDDAYVNSKTPIHFYCLHHPDIIQSSPYNYISRGSGCRFCGIERRSGINSPNYNPNLTEEDRTKKRIYKEYAYWRNYVFERDNYTCQKCGQYGGELNAHHKNGYDKFIDQRLDLANGATLCFTCHKEFHIIYGRGGNTEEQYIAFISKHNKSDYIKGVI
ncbi:HNH endonuclease [Paenibacillus sp. JSM ZJ436]|uniref:HNH endonuclease n=1 Tax=Paenibacillus sp. JSM ZJ436 TaxID=3376190 RepID=UPI0037A781BD